MTTYKKALENIVLPKYKKMDLDDPLFCLHVRIQTILQRIFKSFEHAYIGYYNNVGYEIDSLSLMFEKAGIIIACPAIDSTCGKKYQADIIIEATFKNTSMGLDANGGRAIVEIDLNDDAAAYKVIEYLWKSIIDKDQYEYK